MSAIPDQYNLYEISKLSSLNFKLYTHLYLQDYNPETVDKNVQNIKKAVNDSTTYNPAKDVDIDALKKKLYAHKEALLKNIRRENKDVLFRNQSEQKGLLAEPNGYVYASYPSDARVFTYTKDNETIYSLAQRALPKSQPMPANARLTASGQLSKINVHAHNLKMPSALPSPAYSELPSPASSVASSLPASEASSSVSAFSARTASSIKAHAARQGQIPKGRVVVPPTVFNFGLPQRNLRQDA